MRKVEYALKNKRPNYSRENKLQKSLPYLNTTNMPVFPVLKVKERKEWIWYTVFGVALITAIIFRMVFSISIVNGPSMMPTLHNRDVTLVHKDEKVKRFDIVVLKERLTDNGPSKLIVKRVIGFGGDVITVIDGQLYINNKKYDEPYLQEKYIKNFKKVDWTIVVPKDHIFVLGDNRDISKDSRTVGSFKTSAVMGVQVLGGN